MDASAPETPAEGPRRVFLCGTARSGTTLLARMLDGHPALAVLPADTRVWPVLLDRALPRLVVRLGAVADAPGVTALLGLPGLRRLAFRDRRALEERVRRWLADLPEVRGEPAAVARRAMRTARAGAPYWDAFFDAFFEAAAPELRHCPVRVEKTPSNELLVPLLERLFGDRTAYVHIVRDPRAVVASWMAMRAPPVGRRGPALVDRCVDWSRSAERARRGLGPGGGRYHVVRYETLLVRPREVMQGVAEALGIPWDERLVRPTLLGAPAAPNSSWPGVRAGRVGVLVSEQTRRYGEVLGPDEVATIEELLGPQMESWGYRCAAGVDHPRRGVPGAGLASLVKGLELGRRRRRDGRRSRPPSRGHETHPRA